MNRISKGLTVSAALLGLAIIPQVATAQSQAGWGNLGIHTGWINPAHHADGPEEQMGFDETFGVGASLDFWFGQSRRIGLGFEGTWNNWNEWDTDFGGDFGHKVQMMVYDGSLQFRLATPTQNTRILPALSIGVGGISVNPSDEQDSPFPAQYCEGGVGQDSEGHMTCNFTPADVMLDTRPHTELAIVPGISLDYFFSPSVALRLEGKDYWTRNSPYIRLSDGTQHSGGHNLQLSAGLAFYFGGRQVEEPGFVREEPEVIVREPAPTPPPAPVEERITVCVIDDDGYEIRTIDAIRIPAENRVYVTQNGQRVVFATAYPSTAPVYVRNANWYMTDRPLVVDLETGTATVAAAERNRLELVLFGSPAQRSATDLAFIGTIDGTPVYASRSDVASFRTRIESNFATTTDLGTILKNDAELAREFGTVSSYYVAVEPNCVFQPVSVTHFVRRTRG